jgi:hypothetical protein
MLSNHLDAVFNTKSFRNKKEISLYLIFQLTIFYSFTNQKIDK